MDEIADPSYGGSEGLLKPLAGQKILQFHSFISFWWLLACFNRRATTRLSPADGVSECVFFDAILCNLI